MFIAGLWLCSTLAWAGLQTEEVEYRVGDTVMTGYLAYDDSIAGKRPGVLVVHEWWGHNEYARKRAEMLAALGYTALAVDMYGDGKVADHPDDARAFMMAVVSDMGAVEARFDAARELLMQHETVDSEQIAGIGFCFGGAVVLGMARAGKPLAGVVSFHGSLGTETPAQDGAVQARVLVFNGAADPTVPPEQVTAFEQEMKAAHVDYELINYPGVKHGFTNPRADEFSKRFNMPVAYDAMADQDSWERMQQFFDRIFSDAGAAVD
jgi:dienelactone hydrolase